MVRSSTVQRTRRLRRSVIEVDDVAEELYNLTTDPGNRQYLWLREPGNRRRARNHIGNKWPNASRVSAIHDAGQPSTWGDELLRQRLRGVGLSGIISHHSAVERLCLHDGARKFKILRVNYAGRNQHRSDRLHDPHRRRVSIYRYGIIVTFKASLSA